jgi:RNA recognition motif-containing protein
MIKAMKDTISVLGNEIHDQIIQELQLRGIPLIPVLKLNIVQHVKEEPVILDQADIQRLFSFFGEVLHVSTKHQEAIVHFKTIEAAYFAQKTLHNKQIDESLLILEVSWNSFLPLTKSLYPSKTDSQTDNSFKYTCKYEILVKNSPEFQVSRRIIGPKGKNMKKIIENCLKKLDSKKVDSVKLRLRGLGSGFKEGPFNEESNEPLHLCVSSKDYEVFTVACAEAEKLISNVYTEYDSFLKKRGSQPARLCITTM